MSTAFDMQLFLAGVLTGSHATRQRHIHQAKTIQAAIAERWQLDNPRAWQRKHLNWFLVHRLSQHAESTRYYLLTVQLIAKRLGKAWQFKREITVSEQPEAGGIVALEWPENLNAKRSNETAVPVHQSKSAIIFALPD